MAELGITNTTIRELKDAGYQVKNQETPRGRVYYIIHELENASYFVSGAPKAATTFKWVEVSDIHAGSTYFDEQGFRYVLKKAQDAGFEDVHISGDLVDGYGVYRGQMANLRYWKAEDQADFLYSILAEFPFNYYASKGNHDYSFEMHGSPNPIALIELKMKEAGKFFTFLNSYAGDLIIGGVLKRMVHLSGGKAYAKSYPAQVYLRNLSGAGRGYAYVGGNKYPIRFVQFGHFHTMVEFMDSGIYCTHPGNYQFPTDLTVRLGLVGDQGSLFTECIIGDNRVLEYTSKFVLARR